MYVSNKYKALFVHIPKAGGTAILKMMPDAKRIGSRHDRLQDLENFHAVKHLRAFSIVRNPYYRFISMYRFQFICQWTNQAKHLKRWGSNIIHETHLRSFGDFMKNGALKEIPLLQSDFLRHDRIKPAVFRYEDNAHQRVADWLGIQGKLILDEQTHYFGEYPKKEYSDSEGIDFITEHCARDLQLYDYEPLTWEQLDG